MDLVLALPTLLLTTLVSWRKGVGSKEKKERSDQLKEVGGESSVL